MERITLPAPKLVWVSKLSVAPLVFLVLLSLAGLVPGCSSSEPSKALVKIAEVKLSRPNEQTLRVRFEYDIEQDVTLPLPYPEVLVFPLEPEVKLAGTLKPLTLYTDWIDVSLTVPEEASIDWDDLSDPETCCTVSLKGALATGGYERISNEVHVSLPASTSQSSQEAQQEAQDEQGERDMQDMQDEQDVEDGQDQPNELNTQAIEDTADAHSEQAVQDIAPLQALEDIEPLQNVEDAEESEDVENEQNIPTDGTSS